MNQQELSVLTDLGVAIYDHEMYFLATSLAVNFSSWKNYVRELNFNIFVEPENLVHRGGRTMKL